MSRQQLRPGTTRIVIIIWAVQMVFALIWLVSSVIDEGGSWIWAFAAIWICFALSQIYRARRQSVVVTDKGLDIVTGMTGSTSIDWRIITDITPTPPGSLVTHLCVVLDDGEVYETPLAKSDDRLGKLWHSRQSAR